MKFRKKPVVIQAVQWNGSNYSEIAELARSVGRYGEIQPASGNSIAVQTLEGRMLAGVSDWIIAGVKGELYPCRADIFSVTYEVVE